MADKILAALLKQPPGMNQQELAEALEVEEKSKLKPVLKALTDSRKINKVAGGRYRHADVEIRRGRKPKDEAKAPARAATPPNKDQKRGPGRPKGSGKSAKPGAAAKKTRGRPRGSGKGRKATPAQLAALEKAHAARKKNLAAKKATDKKSAKKSVAKPKSKPARKSANPKKSPAKKASTKKTPAKKASIKKKAVKALPERTDDSGQIPREETRVEPEASAE